MDSLQYQTLVADHYVPAAMALWGHEGWYFQQDTAPSHANASTREWLSNNIPEVLPHPLCSPDLNPMDYSIWSQWQRYIDAEIAGGFVVNNDASLKAVVTRAWTKFTREQAMAIVNNFPMRLMRVLQEEGGHFEGL
eukprot:4473457-Amphidinium_carterae.1